MVYIYKLTITFNKATCIIMPLILGYDRRIHGFCIFGYFTEQCRLEITVFL